MSFCPNCGRKILDESLGCPVCSVRENIDYSRPAQEPQREPQKEAPAEQVSSFTVEDNKGTYQRFESRTETNAHGSQSAEPVQDKRIHPLLKILILVAIFITGTIGYMAGAVAGILLLKSPVEDYHKFGRVILIFCIVLIAISLIGGILFALVGGNMIMHEMLQGF